MSVKNYLGVLLLFATLSLYAQTPPTANPATGITATTFTANWTTMPGATAYMLDVSTNGAFSSYLAGYQGLGVSANSRLVTVPSAGTYHYRVRAIYTMGGISGNSNAINVVIPLPPAAPTAGAATAVTTTSFTANWSSVSGATTYQLDVSTVNNFTTTVGTFTGLTGTNVTGLNPGVLYYYRVRAVNALGTSVNSNIISVTTLIPPIAPTAVTATNLDLTSFTANWSTVSGATSYQLDVSRTNDFSTVTSFSNLTGSYYTVTGLTQGTLYYYRLRAVNDGGTSGNSNIISVTTSSPAVAPTALAATNLGLTSFTANWTAMPGATSYALDVSTSGSFASYLSGYEATGVSTNSRVVAIPSTGTYYYRVRAIYTVGGVSSYSNVITVAIVLTAAPTAGAATAVAATSFTANWSSVSGAATYQLDVSTVNNFTTTVGTFTGLTGTNRNVTGLNPGVLYYYRVRAVNHIGPSVNSNIISITTLSPPIAPTAGAATNVGETYFTANWNVVSGATSYRLDVSTSSTFLTFLADYNNLTVSTNFQNVAGLSANTIYYYRVRAVNTGGTSSNSATVTVLTFTTAPTAIPPTNVTPSSFTANWNSVVGATSYRLDVSTVSDFSTFVSGYNNLTVAGTNANVTNLIDITYYYRVRAINASGASGNSNVIVADNLNKNYIRSIVVNAPGKTSLAQVESATVNERTTTYGFFDGLGRPVQSVTMQATPLLKDIVQPIVYDAFGREAKKYLPFVNGTDGWFKQVTFDASGNYTGIAGNTYGNNASGKIAQDGRPFTESKFEASPLNRILEQAGPGLSWQPDGSDIYTSTDPTVKKAYEFNTAADIVLMWSYTPPVQPNPSTSALPFGLIEAGTNAARSYYAPNQLYKNRTKDEERNEVIEYIDKQGRTILKRVQAVAGSPVMNDDNYASTYYIYDDFGNLVHVLPPEATKEITKTTSAYFDKDTGIKNTFLSTWAFRYVYDARKRMIMKKVPGANAVYLVYDNRDRLVLTADGIQRNADQWSYTKYDALNRPVMTGTYAYTATLEVMQVEVDTYYSTLTTGKAWFESFIGTAVNNVHGYDNASFPKVTSLTNYLTITYYDNYNFRSSWVGNYGYQTDGLSATVATVPYNQPANGTENMQIVGQVTGTKVKVLDGASNAGTGVAGGFVWLKTISYYDDKYRVIQTISDNYKGGEDRISNLYDFVGKVLINKTTHIERDVAWKDIVNVQVIGNALKRVYTGASGAASTQQLAAGQNGWLEVNASETNTTRFIGFNDSNPDVVSGNINYAIRLSGATAEVRENGVTKYTITTSASPGDVFRIARNGSVINYYYNGGILQYSSTAISSALMVDTYLGTNSATLVGVRTSFSETSKSITRTFDYDHAGRLINTWHKIDNGANILLAKNEYNEIGQLVDKKLHSTAANASDNRQSVDYRYNIRGWLTSMNNSQLTNDGTTNNDVGDFFGMNLLYQNNDANLGSTGLFNGNISGMKWSVGYGQADLKELGYNFTYDPMNRLQHANSRMNKTNMWQAGYYDENNLTYDLNGNIKTLKRKGDNNLQVDDLEYSYGTAGNRLQYVWDKTTNTTDKLKGFADGNSGTAVDYNYDVNGNMLHDLNKGIGGTLNDGTNIIKYNFLNLPETVAKAGNTIRYIYDATGRKLSQVVTYGETQKQTDYAGEFNYENDVLQFISHEEGRVMMAGVKLIYAHTGESVSGITARLSATLTPVTQNGAEKYVQVTSSASVGSGAFPIGGAFPVAAYERYKIRVKGYRSTTGATGPFILVKASGVNVNWPGAKVPFGVSSESWVEQIIMIPAGATTLEAGIAWNTNVAGEIFYLNEFEITKLETTTSEYQYNLKDHLGNVRLTFTTKAETDCGLATLESANAATERSKFVRYDNARIVNHYLFDRTNGVAPTTTAGGAQRLAGGTNEKYGLARSLSVMPGDVISMEVYAKYIDSNSTNRTAALNTLISQIATATAPGGMVIDGGGYGASTSSFPFAGGLNGTSGSSGAGPKAYLNWIVFDRNYVLVPGKSGYMRMTTAAREYGQDVAHERLFGSLTVDQPGYVYIYLSNEEATNPYEVYFDQFSVCNTKSPVIQTDDYYPFGLTYNSYTRENSVANDIKFQGQEHQDELGLSWDSFKWRNYMPEVGRFFNVDPLAEKYQYWTPYAFSGNRVIDARELEGLEPFGLRGEWEDKAINAVKYVVEGDAFVDMSKAFTKFVADHQQTDDKTPKPDMTVTITTDGPTGPFANHIPIALDQKQNREVPQDLIEALGSFAKGGPPGSRASNEPPNSPGQKNAPTATIGESINGTTAAVVPAIQAAQQVSKNGSSGEAAKSTVPDYTTQDSIKHQVGDSTYYTKNKKIE
jgi:RHS repeat-associated protein